MEREVSCDRKKKGDRRRAAAAAAARRRAAPAARTRRPYVKQTGALYPSGSTRPSLIALLYSRGAPAVPPRRAGRVYLRCPPRDAPAGAAPHAGGTTQYTAI